jgi:hypothetical protein
MSVVHIAETSAVLDRAHAGEPGPGGPVDSALLRPRDLFIERRVIVHSSECRLGSAVDHVRQNEIDAPCLPLESLGEVVG